jgi:hypothetical protein
MPATATAEVSRDGYIFPTATASAEAYVSSSRYEHPASNTPFDNSGTVHSHDKYLVASAGATAGSYLGLNASANLVEAEDERSQVKVGLSVDTGAGYKNHSLKFSLLGFGFSIGKETGVRTPVFEANYKFW